MINFIFNDMSKDIKTKKIIEILNKTVNSLG